MKLIKHWKDEYYVAENFLYELSNGVRFLYTIKRGIKNYSVDVIFHSGSSIEEEVGVPNGTTHFLEHMLTNPNKRFKTKKQQDEYQFGTKKRASIFSNASTWKNMMSFYTYGNTNSLLRSLKYLKYTIDYPEDRFEEFIEKERGTIIAEINRNYKKEEKDSGLAYDRFAFSEYYPEYTNKIPGTVDTVNSITIEDLLKLKNQIFTPGNCGIAIQSSRKLGKNVLAEVEEIAKLVGKDKFKFRRTKKIVKNEFKYKHFRDEDDEGLFMSMNYFIPIQKDREEYFDSIPSYVARALISYVGFNILREEKGLVYGIESFRSYPVPYNYLQGFKFTTEKGKFHDAIDEFYEVLTNKAIEFINTREGEKWFTGILSNYIFTNTINYNSDYSQNLMFDILLGEREYVRDWDKIIDFAQSISKEDVINYIEEKYIKESPRFWFVSDLKDEEVYNIFKKSKLYKHFNK